MEKQAELPVIQQTYDLILWYVPILNRLPRDHKFALGERMISGLYELLEQLIHARYESNKLPRLKSLNIRLELLRYQTRLLMNMRLIDTRRYEHAAKLINRIGVDLGAWIKQQRNTG
ncbi:MAG: diversity-generating retroelement protein Avd [Blastocatellia bacterium]